MKRFFSMVGLIALAVTGTSLCAEATGPQLEIGAKAPAFELKGTDGKTHTLDSAKGPKGTVVIFTCNHCPFAKAYEDRLIEIAKTYEAQGVRFVAINPNDPKIQPADGFEEMVTRAKEKAFPYPYLVDDTQKVAKAYGAQVTPHVFVFDAGLALRYRGRIDDNAKKDQVAVQDLRNALDSIVKGAEPAVNSTTAFGCSVKWKKSS